MPVFTAFDRYKDMIRTQWRRSDTNKIAAFLRLMADGGEATAKAIGQLLDSSFPLQTASGWILDTHWGPFYATQRNGFTDAKYRLFLLAKRRLNSASGNVDQLLVILRELLPAATSILWTPFYPKQWVVTVSGVPLDETASVFTFLAKHPSPIGGGYSVAGDLGIGVAGDTFVLTFADVDDEVPLSAWFADADGDPVGSPTAGWAHVEQL
jgi:hypothetical protein